MKKVIIYGVKNAGLRAWVRNYLSDKCEMIGVSDSHIDKDVLQGETFIHPFDIHLYPFDYIIILSEREQIQLEIRKRLIELNVEENKIIVPRLLLQKNTEFIPDLKKEIIDSINNNDNLDSVVMGLSYSLRGIDFKRLSLNALDFSWHGLYLYYNYKSLEVLSCKKDIRKIRTALLVFPFYYFNYDMSKSLYQFTTGQIFACRGFEDWHNAAHVPNQDIYEYLVCDKLFGDKFWKYKNWKKISEINESIMEGEGEIKLPGSWKHFYQETWKENEKIMQSILERLKNARILIIVPPIYADIIEKDEMKYFNKMQEKFLFSLKQFQSTFEFEIYDFSQKINDISCFYDYTHLNEKGRLKFTEIINGCL